MVVGGGHNGLTAAAYLARAGWSVLVLERREVLGGAAVSQQVFPGVDVRLSAYRTWSACCPTGSSPTWPCRSRCWTARVASFTPLLRDGRHRGLLVERDGAGDRGVLPRS